MILTLQDIKKHFTNYLLAKWKWLGLSKPTNLQNEIAEYYQHGPDKKIIMGFRGVAKSWIVCSYAEWKWLNDREYRMMLVSANQDMADEKSMFIKRCIEQFDLLSGLRWPGSTMPDLWTNVKFNVYGAQPSAAPSMKSIGITGQLTGSRANEIIPDDVEVPSNSATADQRDKLFKRVSEFVDIIVPGGTITYLGTPQTEESIYNRLETERDFKVRRWPARVPEEAKLGFYGSTLSPIIQKMADEGRYGEPTEPSRFDHYELTKREAGKGRSEFLLQFMLDTSLSDQERYPLKLKDLIVMGTTSDRAPVNVAWACTSDLQIKELPQVGFSGDRFYRPLFIDKEWAPYESGGLFVDPSGRGKDEIGWCVIKSLHGRLFLCDFGGLKGGYEDHNLMFLAQKAKEHKVNLCLCEDNFGDGMFTKLLSQVLRSVHPCRVEEVHSSGQKEKRIIAALEPVLNQHRLIVDLSAIQRDIKELNDDPWYSLMYQLTRLTKDRNACAHDDRLDALALGVKYFTDVMGRNTDAALKQYREDKFKEDLEWFLKDSMTFGDSPFPSRGSRDSTKGTVINHIPSMKRY